MSSREPLAAFGRRNAILVRLGYPSYEAYLFSELWRQIRLRVLERDGWKCCACGEFARQVHHRDYSRATLLGKKLSALVTICYECHRKIEFKNGRKCSPHEANQVLASLRRPHRKRRKRRSPMAHIHMMEEE